MSERCLPLEEWSEEHKVFATEIIEKIVIPQEKYDSFYAINIQSDQHDKAIIMCQFENTNQNIDELRRDIEHIINIGHEYNTITPMTVNGKIPKDDDTILLFDRKEYEASLANPEATS